MARAIIRNFTVHITFGFQFGFDSIQSYLLGRSLFDDVKAIQLAHDRYSSRQVLKPVIAPQEQLRSPKKHLLFDKFLELNGTLTSWGDHPAALICIRNFLPAIKVKYTMGRPHIKEPPKRWENRVSWFNQMQKTHFDPIFLLIYYSTFKSILCLKNLDFLP